jgi:hypothetical protein
MMRWRRGGHIVPGSSHYAVCWTRIFLAFLNCLYNPKPQGNWPQSHLLMPSTDSDSMLRFIVAGLNRGWILAESEQPLNIATKNRICSDSARIDVPWLPCGVGFTDAMLRNISSVDVFGGIATASASVRSEFSPCGRWKILYSLLIFCHLPFSKDIRSLSESSW